MNNEPVAWMFTLPDGTHDWILDGNGCEGYIPLYTHPVKELTDEEYKKLMQQWDYWRKQIADGDTSSAPRDWFESVIDLLKQY